MSGRKEFSFEPEVSEPIYQIRPLLIGKGKRDKSGIVSDLKIDTEMFFINVHNQPCCRYILHN